MCTSLRLTGLGELVGLPLGLDVGLPVGAAVGVPVGLADGGSVGVAVGRVDGCDVGISVGADVGGGLVSGRARKWPPDALETFRSAPKLIPVGDVALPAMYKPPKASVCRSDTNSVLLPP